jgi:hypothetical protein
MFTIELGVQAESNITGLKGTVTSRSEHLNGCNRYWVQPKIGKDGKVPEGMWHDEAELVVKKKPIFERVFERANNDRGGFPSAIK